MQAIVRYKTKEIPKEVRGLFEPGAVCFEDISQFIELEKLDPELLEMIRDALCKKIYEIMIIGNFRDLSGAQELLEKLGIQKISISEEDLSVLEDSHRRISEHDLLVLCTSQMSSHGEYDLVKARRILKWADYSDEELTDERVKKILDWRHVLMQMKRNRIERIGSVRELLEEGA
ncbi:MAG: hypothetical protein WC788_06030 [Candidatus Paceibacterota bacterium]|jgi:hypothetical protein